MGVDITHWLAWFLGCAERAMHNSEKIIADILARADFWRQYAHVEMTARQRNVVNRLLDAGCDGLVGGVAQD